MEIGGGGGGGGGGVLLGLWNSYPLPDHVQLILQLTSFLENDTLF